MPDDNTCRVIQCVVPDDLALYQLNGPAPPPIPPGVAPDVCRVIQCVVPDDLRTYSLSGLPPLPPTNIRGQTVGNAEVYYDFPCEDDPPPV